MPVSPSEINEARGPQQAKEAQSGDRAADFLRLAQERFKRVADRENVLRKQSEDDIKFSIGQQWPQDIVNQRQLDGRPCLTMNRAPQFIRQVTNEQRQQRPATQVNPVGDNTDVETAEILQGTIRHIEVISDAEIAYDHAFDLMTRGGFGYWRVLTDYVNDESFDQDIFIRWIKNPFCVYLDPDATMPDKSDARWAFIVEDIGYEENKEKYPNSTSASLTDFQSIGDRSLQTGLDKNTIRIAEYFYIEEKEVTLLKLADGRVIKQDDYDEMGADHEGILEDFKKEMHRWLQNPTGPEPIQPQEPPALMMRDGQAMTRKTLLRQVKWAKINAIEILQEQEWPGKYIPIIPVVGDDIEIDGQRHVAGLIRHYKDPQRMYNYWVSAATETIALAPKSPYIAAEGQLEGREEEWRQSNVRNLAVLQYKPKDINGNLLSEPHRQQFEPPIQAMRQMTVQADQDMKATTGIYDAALGNRGPDESGKAILARQKQTDVGTLNFTDNLARSIRHSGRILIDLIPHIYDAPRIQRIIKPDGEVQHVGVFNSQMGHTLDEVKQMQQFANIKKIYDIGTGQYDVVVSVGPSYQSKRQEAAQSMMALIQAFPAVFPIIGDLMVRNMDWPYAKEIAERLKKQLPPQLQDGADGDPEIALQQMTQQHAQAVEQLQLMTGQLAEARNIIQTEQVKENAKLTLQRLQNEQERWKMLFDRGTKLAVAEVSAKTQDDQARAEAGAEMAHDLHANLHEVAMTQMEQEHERGMAQINAQNVAAAAQQQAELNPPNQGAQSAQ